MYSHSLPEETKIVQVLTPATDAAGRTSSYVSLKNARKATFIVPVAQGNAAQVTVSVVQATAVAGTGSKAISQACPIWANQDISAGDDLTAQTAATSFQLSTALANKVLVIEVPTEALDLANGFDCVAITTSASNVANLTAGTAVLHGLRYAQATPPSARVD